MLKKETMPVERQQVSFDTSPRHHPGRRSPKLPWSAWGESYTPRDQETETVPKVTEKMGKLKLELYT